MEKQPIPETMLQAVQQFADPQAAQDFFVQIRWPHGVACPRMGCGSLDVYYLKNQRRWNCKDCKKQFSAKVGTIFEDSAIGLEKWLPALWLIASNRNGISSCELARALGVTQKTAWFMLHRLRHALETKPLEKILGPVEVDETYVGGKGRSTRRNPKTGKLMPTGPQDNKTIVMGMVERGGEARAFVVKDVSANTLAPIIKENVAAGTTVYTDALPSYNRINPEYRHHVINHAVEYVNGHIHTNSIEGFWSVFKRTVRGTYIAPRPHHLQRYLEEQVYRFNQRDERDGMRFATAAKQTEGKRLCYKKLIEKPSYGI